MVAAWDINYLLMFAAPLLIGIRSGSNAHRVSAYGVIRGAIFLVGCAASRANRLPSQSAGRQLLSASTASSAKRRSSLRAVASCRARATRSELFSLATSSGAHRAEPLARHFPDHVGDRHRHPGMAHCQDRRVAGKSDWLAIRLRTSEVMEAAMHRRRQPGRKRNCERSPWPKSCTLRHSVSFPRWDLASSGP
jgi:hypothetical protein